MPKDETTPMMRQFHELKAKHPDAVLLFRCGDFYETYQQDAITASRVLGITLTHRSNARNSGNIEMAGFPYHALDTYLPRLVRAGFRVAICDQLEDPKLTRKLVKRGITELVTPGVVLDDSALNSRENNFLAAVCFGKASVGLAFLDISTGEFLVAEGDVEYAEKLMASFAPKELLVVRGQRQRATDLFGPRMFVFELDDWAFTLQTARDRLRRQFGVSSLKGFGVDHLEAAVTAAGATLCYLEQTQHTKTDHITSLKHIEEDLHVRLDNFTVRNLELVSPMSADGHSLLSVIDRTLTPMGARTLRRWLVFPLRDLNAIRLRQDGVETFFRQPAFRDACEDGLSKIGDLERTVSKIAVGRVSPRELQQLRLALECVDGLKAACLQTGEEAFRTLAQQLDACQELHGRIRRTLQPDPPSLVSKGGVIAAGVSAELDELRSLSNGGRERLQEILQRETQATGIASLRLGFNNVFGYYLEVRNTYKERVPQEWIRKQTLVQAERYITPELKEYEEKILGADDRILALEQQLYTELVAEAGKFIALLQRNAAQLSKLDCLFSMAAVARERHYVRPVVDDSLTLDIRQGRHPVIETQMPAGEEYVPNDILLNADTQQIVIVTGPNMAGKSALLRQTALITLLAQTGGFVPAESAHVGLVDKIFTRVGASDNISMGESTFMVEMNEAASIMNNITPRSLVLFDELGRGTSTYDGISIAWAIVENLHENPKAKARTLFATHYHELNEMAALFPRVKNWNVSVKEVDNRVVFLRKLMPGGSEHSFGIHVARMAGMPTPIVRRAEEKLIELEAASAAQSGSPTPKAAQRQKDTGKDGVQLSFFQLDDPVLAQIRDEIVGTDVNRLTPIEALNKLNEIQKILTGKEAR